MVRVFGISENFDASAELGNLLPRLPQWRLRKAMSYRRDIDRFLCAKSFLLLEEMLLDRFGLGRCPEFLFESQGKPYLKNHPGIFFNISHCRRGIVCAVSDSPVGVDIEEIQFDEALAAMVLSPEELASVRASGEPDVAFTRLWTLKESYLKLTGEGIRDNMKEVLSRTDGICFKTEAVRSAAYVYSTARKNGE